MIYVFLLSFFFVSSLFDSLSKSDKEVKTALLLLYCLILTYFAGLRYEIGTDYRNYLKIYNDPESYDHMEFLFYNSVRMANFFHWSYNTYLFAVAAISITIKIAIFYRKLGIFTIPVFFYFTSNYLYSDIGSVRIGLAISFLFLSLDAIKKRNIFKFILLASISIMIHRMTLFFIPIYFLGLTKIHRKLFSILNLTTILIGITGIFPIFLESLNGLFTSYQLSYFTKLSGYLMRETSTLPISAILKKVIILMFMFTYHKRIKDDNEVLFFNIVAVGYIVYFLGLNGVSLITTRIASIFTWFEPFLFTKMILSYKKSSNRILIATVLALFAIGSFFVFLDFRHDNFFPYQIKL